MSENPRWRKRRVLLVDDDEQCHQMYGTALEFYGFDVDRATNGAEGIERVASTPPDVVLMDIAMPVLDGLAALRRLRSDQRTRTLPIVAITATVSVHEIGDLLDAGFCDVLLKPVDPVNVVKVARKWSRAVRIW